MLFVFTASHPLIVNHFLKLAFILAFSRKGFLVCECIPQLVTLSVLHPISIQPETKYVFVVFVKDLVLILAQKFIWQRPEDVLTSYFVYFGSVAAHAVQG